MDKQEKASRAVEIEATTLEKLGADWANVQAREPTGLATDVFDHLKRGEITPAELKAPCFVPLSQPGGRPNP